MQSPRRDDGNPHRINHLRDEAHRGRLLAAVVPAGLKALRHDGIHAGGLGLPRKHRTGHHVDHRASSGLQMVRPFPRGTCTGEDHGHAFLGNRFHVLLHGRIQQRNVDGKRAIPRCLDPGDFRPQLVGVHRPRSQRTQASGAPDGHNEVGPGAPNHAGLDDGVPDAEEIAERLRGMRRVGHARKIAPNGVTLGPIRPYTYTTPHLAYPHVGGD